MEKEINEKYKWDLTQIYATDADFEADFKLAEQMIKEFPKHEKTMLKSADGLFAALSDMSSCERKIEKLWSYAHLGFSLNAGDNAAQGRSVRVRSLAANAGAASWFLSPYIMRLDSATVDAWYGECEGLKSYKRMIDTTLAHKPYMLSDECEQLMAKMSDCLHSHNNIRSIFADSDLQFGKIRDESGKPVELTDVNYVSKLMSPERRVRQSAFTTLYKTYEQFGNTFSTMYSSHVKEQCTLAKIRGYKNSITASTFRDEVTPVIYNTLIDSVHKAMPVVYDY
ncbi:MAG: hypothetical protein IJW03_05810, partial [Clostridia bacterium]|nr:hypothetical protein [Clostridia bacterium]